MQVTLTPDEIHTGAIHGVFRRCQKHAGLRGDREQMERSLWDNEIEGALAELAWCKGRNTYWTGLGALRAKDGSDVEIRWTRHADGGLIIYERDDPFGIFVLAKGYAPTFTFTGWLLGGDGKQIGRQMPFGFLVASSDLKPLPSSAPPTP